MTKDLAYEKNIQNVYKLHLKHLTWFFFNFFLAIFTHMFSSNRLEIFFLPRLLKFELAYARKRYL